MIGITMGDPNGVGPEIILQAFSGNNMSVPCLVIGDLEVLDKCNSDLKYEVNLVEANSAEDYKSGYLNVLDLKTINLKELTIGKISERGGRSSLDYINKATDMALEGQIEAFVTLPINKEAVRLVDPEFQGHTDYIASMCGVRNYTMMLVSDRLIVTHISMHVSMRQALDFIKKERISDVIRLTDQVVRKLRPPSRLAVAGLNPHAGEHGAFGIEEIEEIGPAVEHMKEEGIDVEGPFPPDTVFYQAVNGKYDAVICMYHDQGHIPMKLIDFDKAINVTLGLPIVRTSVDHGTAYDIAWKGKASITSFINAFELASRLSDLK